MSSSIGGQVKVTLTLDDAGFSMKIKEAGTQVKSLGTNLSSLGRMSETVETKLGTLGKNVSMSSTNLKTLTASAAALDKQFGNMRESMASFNSSSELASKNAGMLNGVVLKLAALLDGAAANTNRAATANNRLATSQKQLASSTQATVNGLTAQERAVRNLGTGHEDLAKKIVLAAGLARNEHAKTAAAEINANNQTLAARQRSLDSALKAEREFRARLATERSKEQALQWRVENRRDDRGRILGASSPVLAQYQAELRTQQEVVRSLQMGLNILGQEATRLTGNMDIIRQQNTQLQGRIGLEGRIEQALNRQKMRAEEYLRTQRLQAQQQREALEMTRQQMDMVKGMAQLYGSSKVWQGEKSSVSKAGEFQRTGVRAKAMGLTPEEQAQFDMMAQVDSKRTPGLNVNDAATARIAAMGGLASKNQRQINQTLPTAIDAAQNVGYLTGDDGHESFENTIRNFYGVAEARQVQYDPAKTKSTMEMLQKIIAATGNKIDIKDIETLLRRVDPGNAAQLSNDGIINAVSLMDQLKVSGGGGGGGAGGVSTLGTMIKMLQAYGNGKTMSNEMVKQFAEAGLLNTDSITSKNADGSVNSTDASIKKFMAEAKKAGFANVAQLNADPISAIRDMMKNVLATISSPENKKKYFGDADINDPDAQRNAISKWASRNGMTTTATGLLKTIADPRMQERIDHQHEMVTGSQGIDELKAERMKTYEQQVKNFTAAMDNLKITLGTSILPMMTKFFEWMTNVINKMNEFGSNNPMAAQLTMIGGAVAGAVLGLAGMARMIGLVGGLSGIFRALGTEAAAGAGKVGILSRTLSVIGSVALAPLRLVTTSLSLLARAVTGPLLTGLTGLAARFTALSVAGAAVKTMLSSLAAPFVAMGTRIAVLGARWIGFGGTMTAVASVVGKAFLRMIPFVGWLIAAWELTDLLLEVQVGFASIGDWMDHWMAQSLNKVQVWAAKLRNGLRFSDESKGEGDERIKQLQAEAEAEQKAFDEKRKRNEQEKKDADDKKAAEDKKTKEQQDFIDGKGFEHVTPTVTPGTAPADGFTLPEAQGKQPRDQFIRSLADVTKNAEITAMKISNAIRGTSDSLYDQARVEFFEKWRAGDFDPNHDANLRPFKNGSGGLDWNAAGKDGAGPQKWIETRQQMLEQEEQLKAITYANERVAAARQDASTAMERGTETTVKDTREMAGLQRELARTEERLRNGTKEFAAWNQKKHEALFERARSDTANFTADFAEGDRTTQTGMIFNSKDRVGAEFDNRAQKDKETFDLRMKRMTEYYDLARKEIDDLDLNEAESAKRKAELDTEFNETRIKAESEYTNHVKVQADARAYAMRGAIAKQQQDWENSFDKMDQVAAQWGEGFVDSLSTWLTGGSVSWKEFLQGMLKDVLSLQLKEAFAKPMASALDGMSGFITDTLSSKKGSGAGDAAAAGAPGLLSSMGNGISSARNMVQSGFSNVAGMLGFDKLSAATKVTTDAVKGLATDGAAQATAGLVKNAAQTAVSTGADTQAAITTNGFTLAVNAATSALVAMAATAAGSSASSGLASGLGLLGQLGAAAYGGYSGSATATTGVTSGTGTGMGLGQTAVGPSSVFGFANGGIMTDMGPLPLKKYANGGIASSPQLALFGEGKHREAFVPLPDGRSIPVTFSGDSGGGATAGAGGGGNLIAPVTISIVINRDGSEEQTSNGESNDRETATKMATQVKAIVREVLLSETRPNGILDKRK